MFGMRRPRSQGDAVKIHQRNAALPRDYFEEEPEEMRFHRVAQDILGSSRIQDKLRAVAAKYSGKMDRAAGCSSVANRHSPSTNHQARRHADQILDGDCHTP